MVGSSNNYTSIVLVHLNTVSTHIDALGSPEFLSAMSVSGLGDENMCRLSLEWSEAPLHARTCSIAYGVVQCLPLKSPTIYRRILRREKNDRLVSVHTSIDCGEEISGRAKKWRPEVIISKCLRSF